MRDVKSEPGRTFGRAIQEARTDAGLTQKALAARLDISPQYVNDIERNRRKPPPDDLIERCASTLGIDAMELYVLSGRIPQRFLAERDALGAEIAKLRERIFALAAHKERLQKVGLAGRNVMGYDEAFDDAMLDLFADDLDPLPEEDGPNNPAGAPPGPRRGNHEQCPDDA
jgi:transcriptional regulator with XRE-family HTH domain